MAPSLDSYRSALELYLEERQHAHSIEADLASVQARKPKKPESGLSTDRYRSLEKDATRRLQDKIRGNYVYEVEQQKKGLGRKVEREMRVIWGDVHAEEANKKGLYEAAKEAWWREACAANAKLTAAQSSLEVAREMVREEVNVLWPNLPVLPSDIPNTQANDFGQVFWRGTILRRLILSTNGINLIHSDNFMGGTIEFAPDLQTAVSFAKVGSANDGVRGADRHDPVVLQMFVRSGEWEDFGYKTVPPKWGVEVGKACRRVTQIFRLA